MLQRETFLERGEMREEIEKGVADLLRELYVGHTLESLVIVSQLCVESQKPYKTVVAQLLVQRVASKHSWRRSLPC